MTLIADWPGIGRKGEKVIAHWAVRWITDKKGLEDEGYAGKGMGKSIYFWDPVLKKIRNLGVDSGGTIFESETWKEGDKWLVRSWGSLADGAKTEGKASVIVQDGGNTLIFEGEGTVGGKKTLPLHDVYRRASK